ncbi:AfsA-related hotdog domain-containing protein [Amycolatopsis sp. A133]|uniref:AfsA-related hotdog domain-containing protein n=1 Tax=Amycolatopsis sp. A133 TaxID=3064472 RepID=UPI0027FA6ACA|nr:AfsA-related hotdog domain-containing protein [Amycolatopsis sp. A133]MDQ7809176.1 AfsA-related hotdog domain-containing protein [Amycolatopsis sp. A133]
MAPREVSCPETPSGEDWALAGYTRRDVVVVADRFAQFARGDRVLTLSGLLGLLDSGGLRASGCHWVVHFGQGIDATDGDLLEAACDKSEGTVRLADPDSFRRPPEHPVVVHKDRPENVLLAGVHSPLPTHCRAELRIHRDNELVLDHHTGEHVQGIVIIEAMRQICIAQFETAIRPGLPPAAYAGVWKRIDLSFEDFLFPLPATVESLIVESDLGRETNLKFRATTAVRQQGRTVATAGIEYSMIAQGRVDTLERRKADQATRAYLG